MQHFSLDRENMTKYGKADRPGSRQADRQGGREEGGLVEYSVATQAAVQNTTASQRGPNAATFPDADELIGISWDGCLLLDDGALIGREERNGLPHLRESKARVRNGGVSQSRAANPLWRARSYLCSADEPPGTEQTEAMLVAVVETSTVYLPVCALISLFNK